MELAGGRENLSTLRVTTVRSSAPGSHRSREDSGKSVAVEAVIVDLQAVCCSTKHTAALGWCRPGAVLDLIRRIRDHGVRGDGDQPPTDDVFE